MAESQHSTSNSDPDQRLLDWLRNGAHYVEENNIAHPIEHNPIGIEHPIWPIVSFLARDHVPGLFAELNPFSLVCRPKDQPRKEDADYLLKAQSGIMAGVLHFTTALLLPKRCYLPDPEPDMRVSEVVFNFLNRPGFNPLILAASGAKARPNSWFSFVASTWVDGFLNNVMEIGQTVRSKEPESTPDYSSLVGSDADEIAFRLRQHFQSKPPSSLEEMNELCSTWQKAKDSEKRRLKRHAGGTTPRNNKHRDLILSRWLDDALWCRTSAAIVSRYDKFLGVENADGHEDSCARIDQEISKLGLSYCRRSEHNELIEKAEKEGLAALR